MPKGNKVGFESQLLPILRCQRCGGGFVFTSAMADGASGASYGVLRCSCGKYPVVDGIPILLRRSVGMFDHTTGTSEVSGVEPNRLVELIEQGKGPQALEECLVLPVLPSFMRRMIGWRLSNSPPTVRLARRMGRRRLQTRVLSKRTTLSAVDVTSFFYEADSPLGRAVGDYFRLRFGQPRHLAALALIQNFTADEKPLLDLACGCGHMDHYLTSRGDAARVIGMDLNFFHLWIARHWIAPSVQYVCGAADEGLPFATDSFSGMFCSDAYHLMPNRRRIHAEIERCAPGRLCVVSRAGNAEVMPNEGLERTVSGYLEDIGVGDARVMEENELVRLYLERRNPLAESNHAGVPQRAKWLSFAWNLPAHAPDRGPREWPHAVGQLGLNPIYRCKVAADGSLDLRFEFPGVWYAYENNGMLAYHPRHVSLSREQLDALASDRVDSTLSDLVSKFVLLGLPERFVHPHGEFRLLAQPTSRAAPDA